jgi:hypothetical protein
LYGINSKNDVRKNWLAVLSENNYFPDCAFLSGCIGYLLQTGNKIINQQKPVWQE